MKQLLQIFTVLTLVLAFTAAHAQNAKIEFDEMEHDFGTFKESAGPQTTTFKFTNTGAQPLLLQSVRASCGCTTPKYTKEPVPPGGTGEIQVSYNPKNRPGSFNKSVTVRTNAENATSILRIKGRVQEREKTLAELYPRKIGDLRVKTNHISFARMKQSDVKKNELELVNDSDSPITVGFNRMPDHVTAELQPKTIQPNQKGKLVVTYDADKANTYGFTNDRIYLTLNGSDNYRNSVGVSATIEEDFSHLSAEELKNAPVAAFSSKSHDFGEMAQGSKKEYTFTLENKGKSELVIRKVRSSCGCTAVAPSKKVIAPGESAPIKVTFDSRGKRGRQSKSVTVITNDPKTPTTTLRISSNITT